MFLGTPEERELLEPNSSVNQALLSFRGPHFGGADSAFALLTCHAMPCFDASWTGVSEYLLPDLYHGYHGWPAQMLSFLTL